MKDKQYYLSAIVHAKNEAPYLDEWISFHRAIGVEHFWIYDNGSQDNIRAALQPHMDVAELIDWPQVPAFPASMEDGLRRATGRTTWLALIDADEFLVPDGGRPEDLLALLREAEPWAGQVVCHWRMFGSNGHVAMPRGRVTDNYMFRDARRYAEFKSIIQPAHIGGVGSTHWFHEAAEWPRWDSDRLHIYHYRQKSQEDFFLRESKGQVDAYEAGNRLWHWNKYEETFNEVYDEWAAQLGQRFNTPSTHREFGISKEMMQTAKSRQRRLAEGWFDRYAPDNRPGIDIGCQHDRINGTFQLHDWMFGHADAQMMEDRADESYFTVYANHVLEHLSDPLLGLRNWWRILQRGGHMIVVVPHRDLYEKKKSLPSNGNSEHKTFWLPWQGEPPCTFGLIPTILQAVPDANIVSVRILDDYYQENPGAMATGELSIEAIARK